MNESLSVNEQKIVDNEIEMYQRLYNVVSVLSKVILPMAEVASTPADGEVPDEQLQAIQALQDFVALHEETEQLKAQSE